MKLITQSIFQLLALKVHKDRLDLPVQPVFKVLLDQPVLPVLREFKVLLDLLVHREFKE
jgi:hypothetical protein